MSYFITRGWYLIIAGVILGVLNLLSIEGTYIPSKQEVIIFFTEIVSVVLFEEMLFRGIIQNYIMEDFEKGAAQQPFSLSLSAEEGGFFR